ncbi:MAG: hypothetical protein KGS72_28965 [Cyanobacteria bacterium REEB67]|nr:hypothetical protein [Cyanobacteria bacterium REEB67]
MKTNETVAHQGEDLGRGIERVIALELSDMVSYQSLSVDVEATRDAILSSHNPYAQTHFFAEGAD